MYIFLFCIFNAAEVKLKSLLMISTNLYFTKNKHEKIFKCKYYQSVFVLGNIFIDPNQIKYKTITPWIYPL